MGSSGGLTELGFKKTLVDRGTVEAYNQIAQIKWNQEYNIKTKLVDKHDFFSDNENEIANIDINDEIPYELWNTTEGNIK